MRKGILRRKICFSVIIASVMVPVFSTRSNAEWPTYNADYQRSGVTSEKLTLPLTCSWIYHNVHLPQPAWPLPAQRDITNRYENLRPLMDFDRAFHVVSAGNLVFFGSSADNKVYALDAKNGSPMWEFFTEGPIRMAPSVANGKLYVGSDDGNVYCLLANSGKLLWKFAAYQKEHRICGNGRVMSITPIRTGIIVDSNTVYFGAGLFPRQQVWLYALDASQGTVRWKTKSAASLQGYMLASAQHLYIPTGRTDPVIHARADGKSLGSLTGLGGAYALLTDDDLISGPGRREKGLRDSNVITKEAIATFDGLRMVIGQGTAYVLSETSIWAFDRNAYNRQLKQGKTDLNKYVLWKTDCDCRNSIILADQIIFVGGEGKVVARDAKSGTELWSTAVDGSAYSLSVANGRLLVSTSLGKIYCFNTERNTPKQKIITPKITKNPFPKDIFTDRYAEAAQLIIDKSGIRQGYCLVLDCNQGRLAYEIAKRTELQIIGVENDKTKVAAARAALDRAGLYGVRVTIHQGLPEKLGYTPYFANLIVSDDAVRNGQLFKTSSNISRLLRPCGGTIAIVLSDNRKRNILKEWGLSSFTDWQVNIYGKYSLGMAHRGPLDGAGEWTHTYAEPGNNSCSGDQLVKGDLDIQWFGEPGPRDMADRHFRNVPPLYKNGRMFISGNGVIYAVDAYNGTILWKLTIPQVQRLGVFLDTSNMAVDDKCLYVANENLCLAFDVETGKQVLTYFMPDLIEKKKTEWGYLAYTGKILLGSGRPWNVSYKTLSRQAELNTQPVWYPNMKVALSDFLFALDQKTGKQLWKYLSGKIIDTTLAVGGKHVYFVETHNPQVMEDNTGRLAMRTIISEGKHFLVALNSHTGKVAYKKQINLQNFQQPTYLNCAQNVLLLSGSMIVNGDHIISSGTPAIAEKDQGGGPIRYYYQAFNSATGKLLWQANHDTKLPLRGGHGEFNRHPTIIANKVYTWPYAYDLKTGRRDEKWKFDRHGGGCGNISASIHCMFWRGGNPWMLELDPINKAQPINKVTRPGCFINILPVGGLVLIPEASSGCTCGYPMQMSIAFVPRQ